MACVDFIDMSGSADRASLTQAGIRYHRPADGGKSRIASLNLLRLLELADEVKALVESRQLEMGHARALLGLAASRQQAEVAALVGLDPAAIETELFAQVFGGNRVLPSEGVVVLYRTCRYSVTADEEPPRGGDGGGSRSTNARSQGW